MTESASTNPFLRYRWLLGVDREAVASGMPDENFCRLVAKLDAALVEVDGKGFEAPPLPIASEIGLEVPTLGPDRHRLRQVGRPHSKSRPQPHTLKRRVEEGSGLPFAVELAVR